MISKELNVVLIQFDDNFSNENFFKINTMTTLTEKLAALPPNLVQEVDDFVDFLLIKHLSSSSADILEEMQHRKRDIEQDNNIVHFSAEEWEAYCEEHRLPR